MTDPVRWTVPRSARGSRIDNVIAAELETPRARAQALLGRGAVTVDGDVVAKSFRVRGGECVEIAASHPPPPVPPPPVPVRVEDDHLAVVAKPAGMVVHAGAGVRGGTLVDALAAMGMTLAPADDPERPGIVHRLDRGTSGLLVVAKTSAVLRELRAQFDARTVGRRYWALIEGVPEHRRAIVDAPIARHPRDRTRYQTAPDGRQAVSHYVVERTWRRASHVDVRLETGRTHQVRVHMAALDHPVCGDLVYGASSDLAAGLGLDRPALHARHLAFDHPVTRERVTVDEPLPDDLRQAVRHLDAGRV